MLTFLAILSVVIGAMRSNCRKKPRKVSFFVQQKIPCGILCF